MKFEEMTQKDFEEIGLYSLRKRKEILFILKSNKDVHDFSEFTEKDFYAIGCGDKTVCKYLWLQKYLAGEDVGSNFKTDSIFLTKITENKEIASLKKIIDEKDKKIKTLCEKIKILEEYNYDIVRENDDYKKLFSKLDKLKKDLEDFKLPTKE